MRKGIAAVEEGGSKGGFTGKVGYFNIKVDESQAIRFITDLDEDVITLDFWEFIVDNKNKPQNFAVAADVHGKGATDYVIELGAKAKEFGSDELVDPSPKTRSVGMAVVCKEVATEVNGKRKLTYIPEEIDVPTKGGVKKGYQFVIVKQAYKNFWGPLKTHWEENGKTICDRVYKIKRVDSNTYTFMEKQPDPAWEEDPQAAYEALKAEFGYGQPVDLDDDDRFKKAPMTLEQWAEESCSEQRVNYFLGDEADRDAQNEKSKAAAEERKSGKKASDDDDDDEDTVAAAPKGGGNLTSRFAKHKQSASTDDDDE